MLDVDLAHKVCCTNCYMNLYEVCVCGRTGAHPYAATPQTISPMSENINVHGSGPETRKMKPIAFQAMVLKTTSSASKQDTTGMRGLLQNLTLGGCGLDFHGLGSPQPRK